MKRKSKGITLLLILAVLCLGAWAWMIQSFSLNAFVSSYPNPDRTTDPPQGQVALSAVQMRPTYRFPITFTSVEVQDSVTKEMLEPGLVLYDEEPVHLLMASSWVGTPEDFSKEFSEGPHLSVDGGTLTSKNIVLGTLWSHWPDWDHPTEYTLHYKLYGLFPKSERLVFDWAQGRDTINE